MLITDITTPEASTAPLAGEPAFQQHDVRSAEDWQRVLAWCESTWGGLDVLVNNAGVAAAGRIERLQISDWDWILDINLKGAVLGCDKPSCRC